LNVPDSINLIIVFAATQHPLLAGEGQIIFDNKMINWRWSERPKTPGKKDSTLSDVFNFVF
jgi:hypothetical protein